MDTGEILRITMNYIAPNSSAVQNVFHWLYGGSGDPDGDVMDAVADWTTDEWAAAWDNFAGSAVSLDTIEGKVVNPLGEVIRDLGVRLIDIPGSAGGEILGAAVSGYLTVPTAIPGHRGSKYVPGAGEALTTQGAFGTTAVTALLTLLGAYLNSIDVGGVGDLVPGIPSRTLNQFVEFLTEGSTTNIPAYQRRRKPDVGE